MTKKIKPFLGWPWGPVVVEKRRFCATGLREKNYEFARKKLWVCEKLPRPQTLETPVFRYLTKMHEEKNPPNHTIACTSNTPFGPSNFEILLGNRGPDANRLTNFAVVKRVITATTLANDWIRDFTFLKK
jgi:hypothetical protein